MRIYCCECGQDTGVETDCEVTATSPALCESCHDGDVAEWLAERGPPARQEVTP